MPLDALRDQTFKTELAGLLEESQPDSAFFERCDEYAVRRPRRSRAKLDLRMESGRSRRSSPSIARRRRSVRLNCPRSAAEPPLHALAAVTDFLDGLLHRAALAPRVLRLVADFIILAARHARAVLLSAAAGFRARLRHLHGVGLRSVAGAYFFW
jgi:hypothetical protein